MKATAVDADFFNLAAVSMLRSGIDYESIESVNFKATRVKRTKKRKGEPYTVLEFTCGNDEYRFEQNPRVAHLKCNHRLIWVKPVGRPSYDVPNAYARWLEEVYDREVYPLFFK